MKILSKVTKTDEAFVCDNESCTKTFDSKKKLYDHSYKCHLRKDYQCDKCPAAFAVPSALKSHQRVHKAIKCPFAECSLISENYKLYRKHKALCAFNPANANRPECVLCTKNFSSKIALRKHERKIHPRLVKCTVAECGSMVLPYQMIKHFQECHTDKLPSDGRKDFPGQLLKKAYICDLCDAKYSQVQYLRRHCIKKHPEHHANSSNAAQQHHSGVERQKKFSCTFDLCNRKFLSKVKLESHVNWHTDSRPYACPECSANFCGKLSLQRHTRRAHLRRLDSYTVEQLEKNVDLATEEARNEQQMDVDAGSAKSYLPGCDVSACGVV